MTNYNERLDEILERHGMYAVLKDENRFDDVEMEREFPAEVGPDKTKQALTSLIKELVAEAKPSKKHVGDEVAENRSYTGERLFNATIDEYHTNLLKEFEEV